ncbi:hypothetical protein IANJMKHF_00196 [Klebsiella phage CPRSA]|nr:hypothetical protein IANJMKHF_00196 [Klebsiella phage CPRSA]
MNRGMLRSKVLILEREFPLVMKKKPVKNIKNIVFFTENKIACVVCRVMIPYTHRNETGDCYVNF